MSDRPDEFRRQLGALWKTAMFGLDTMRDVVVRSSQTGRLRVDIALLHTERGQLLQQLGEQVLRLFDEGQLDDGSADQLRPLRDRIRDVESRIRTDSARATDNAFGAPRGFEPEAAADYGQDDKADEEPHVSPKAAARNHRPAKRSRTSARTRTK